MTPAQQKQWHQEFEQLKQKQHSGAPFDTKVLEKNKDGSYVYGFMNLQLEAYISVCKHAIEQRSTKQSVNMEVALDIIKRGAGFYLAEDIETIKTALGEVI